MWFRIMVGCWILVIVLVTMYRISRTSARDVGRVAGRWWKNKQP